MSELEFGERNPLEVERLAVGHHRLLETAGGDHGITLQETEALAVLTCVHCLVYDLVGAGGAPLLQQSVRQRLGRGQRQWRPAGGQFLEYRDAFGMLAGSDQGDTEL